jgi:alpha-N-acetylglucosaminidase
MYEYVFEKAWDFDTHKDLDMWSKHLADEHVGKADANAQAAWKLLLDSIYVEPSHPGDCSMTNIRPTFGKFKTYYANPRYKYQNTTLLQALKLMLTADSQRPAYIFDIVNLTRQLLGNYFWTIFKDYEKAYNANNYKEMKSKEIVLTQILNDLDRLLQTQNTFLMGKWIKEAREKGLNDEEKLYYERNARNLLTTWGAKAGDLNDYASRMWSGLISTFYGQRWNMFFAAVDRAVIAGQKFDDIKFKEYVKEVTDYEEMWWKDCIGDFPSKPIGNGLSVAKELYLKYSKLIYPAIL